ncbi:ABC transporter substrate-binding protein [Paenibacillus arenilitoris]|uniref:Extracellular solute-binding protein n=1 Tax=Paenibacillus arenilitoris TaxID=2772299 RepID=A0A927H5Q5_9BACL|nr:extracellular solute-binding protein [Paenibacillus arenilitoris]MBD2868788.1 extracellular solute-binding protein [Paenibacillus arenilitoris]
MKTTKWFSMMVALVMVLTIAAGCGNNAGGNAGNEPAQTDTPPADGPKELEGKLVVWTFFDQVKEMGAKFEEKHPGVKVEVNIFPGDQYQTKLLSAMQSGNNVPDVFDLERGYIGKFIDANFIADLSAMGIEEQLTDYIPYVRELGRAADGTIRAVSDHSSPGSFWYIRENAKKYLGTDDPDQISEMVGSWDKIIELGKKVYEQSGGKAYLMQNAGDVFDIAAYNTEPWVKDGKLNIDPKWKTYYETQQQIRANNVDAKLGFMSAGWGNALNDGTAVLSAMPAWATFMIDNKDDKAVGKFGVAKSPEGFYTGGTYRGIYEKSPNKELAYEFIKYIASPEWQEYNLGKTGNMPASGKVYQDNMDTFKVNLLGDQNPMKIYYELVNEMPGIAPDKYGEEVLSKWRKVAGQGITDNTSYDDVVASFKKEVKNAFPDIQVD